MTEAEYEDLCIWQDVLEDVVNGRTENLICPFCEKKAIEVDMSGRLTEVKCTECGRWFKGELAY